MTILPGTEVLPVTTRGHTMNQAHVATLHRTPLHPPDPGLKVKRASPGPTAQRKTSTQPPAPRNSLWDDHLPAPTPDPCPGRALAPGPGPDASLEDTDCLFLQLSINLYSRMFFQLSTLIIRVFCSLFAFVIITLWRSLLPNGEERSRDIFLAPCKRFCFD